MVADEDAADARRDRQGDGDDQGVVEAAGDELCADAGGDEQGDDENNANRLHRADGGQRQHDEQAGAQQGDVHAGEAGLRFVEGVEQVVAPFDGEDGEDDGADGDDLPQLRGGHAKQVAEEDVGEVLIGAAFLVEEEAGGKEGGEGDAEQGVAFQRAAFFEPAGGERTGETGDEGAEDERRAEAARDDDAGQDGVRDGIAHQRPAFVDDVAGEQGAGDGEQQRDSQRLLHEGVLQGFKDGVHGAVGRGVAGGGRQKRRGTGRLAGRR